MAFGRSDRWKRDDRCARMMDDEEPEVGDRKGNTDGRWMIASLEAKETKDEGRSLRSDEGRKNVGSQRSEGRN